MKYILLSLFLLSFLVCPAKKKNHKVAKSTRSYAVDTIKYIDEAIEETKCFGSMNIEPDKEQVFKSVEVMPTYPGGDASLMEFLSQNIKYPAMAQKNNIQGRVVVQFVVTKTGEIGEVKVVRSVDPELDAEAVRVVKLLSRFTPGKADGKSVNVWYTLPITFRLSNDEVWNLEGGDLTADQMIGLYIGYQILSDLVPRTENLDNAIIQTRLDAHLKGFNESSAYASGYELAAFIAPIAYDMKNNGVTLDTHRLAKEFKTIMNAGNKVNDDDRAAAERDVQNAMSSKDGKALGKAMGRYLAYSTPTHRLTPNIKKTLINVIDYTFTKCDLTDVNEVAAIMGASGVMGYHFGLGTDLTSLKEYCAKALASKKYLSKNQLQQLEDAIDEKLEQKTEE